MSQPAISKPLQVLERAGLVKLRRQDREHLISVDPRPIEDARTWIACYARFWKVQFDDLDAFLAAKENETN